MQNIYSGFAVVAGQDSQEIRQGFNWNLLLIVDRFYIALFSVFEQTHCALVACNSECNLS